MTEWLVLVLLIPLILVPVVLLFGFAGCQLVFPLEDAPPVFEPVFNETLDTDRDRPIRTIVQRIEAVRLGNMGSGNHVRIVLQPPETGSLAIAHIYISQAATTGKLWDSAEDLKAVFPPDPHDPNQVLQLAIPAGSAPVELEVDYQVDRTKALLLAFDIADPGNTRCTSLPIPVTQAAAFVGPLVNFQIPPLPPIWEASIAVRRPDYTQDPRIFIVTRIDVAP